MFAHGFRWHMLVAPSGGGKSTLCWALLQHGFRYTSDELAPVELAMLDVHPYPRTLILEREPALPYQLPARTLRTEAGARLFANALDPLAHEGGGLDGAIRIAKGLSSFELVAHDLGETCRLVRATLDRP